MIKPSEIKKRYEQGENISAWLRKAMKVTHNTPEIIEISYDLQAGSYIGLLKNCVIAEQKAKYSQEIAQEILALCHPESILEAGVGEATTLSGVLKNIGSDIKNYGIDISWSRVAYAKKWLKEQNIHNSKLCTGDLFNIPFLDSSVDVVYTSHSIEPNGGNEIAILRELYRVARKYIVLFEPAYELASDEARRRMDSHGYCKNLVNIATSLGYDVIKHDLITSSGNKLNPTAITIIYKNVDVALPDTPFACPKYKSPLKEIDGALYSPEALIVYPILSEIPCLRIENGIFASKFEDINTSTIC